MSESATVDTPDAESAWTALDRAGRRSLIVTTALELLETGGPEAATMRTIAERIGIGTMTIYTYVEGRAGLQRAMVREGFARLDAACRAASTLHTSAGWRGGARAYLRFALDHPALYRLLFDAPLEEARHDPPLVAAGLRPLLEKVRRRLRDREPELDSRALEDRARRDTARFWIALHGLATLAIADRLGATGADAQTLLEDLLERVAPG